VRAHEVSFLDLVQGEKQFQVPLYQRTYSWGDKHLAQLWRDLLAQGEAMTAAEMVGIMFALLGILGGLVGAPSLGEAEQLPDVDGEVAHEAVIGNHETAQDFGQVSPFHQGHFFPSFHSSTLCVSGDWMLKINGLPARTFEQLYRNYKDRIEAQSTGSGPGAVGLGPKLRQRSGHAIVVVRRLSGRRRYFRAIHR